MPILADKQKPPIRIHRKHACGIFLTDYGFAIGLTAIRHPQLIDRNRHNLPFIGFPAFQNLIAHWLAPFLLRKGGTPFIVQI